MNNSDDMPEYILNFKNPVLLQDVSPSFRANDECEIEFDSAKSIISLEQEIPSVLGKKIIVKEEYNVVIAFGTKIFPKK